MLEITNNIMKSLKINPMLFSRMPLLLKKASEGRYRDPERLKKKRRTLRVLRRCLMDKR